jgi:hypothetical protein
MSNFQVAAWIPKYLRWYRLAFGRQLTLEELRKRASDATMNNREDKADREN